GRHAYAQAEGEAVVAAQNAVARFPHHQNERDEERHEVAGIDLAQPGPERAAPPAEPPPERRGGHGTAPAEGGSVRVLRRSTTSSTPRLNRSTSATARPSYSSVTPTAAATSVQPARPRFTSTRDRSYPDRLALPMAGQLRASSNTFPFAPATFDMAYQ